MSQLHQIANIIGIFGVIFILLAYFLLQTNRLAPHKFLYSGMNLVGALMILFSLYFDWNLSAALVEGAWAIISLYGLYAGVTRRFKKKEN